MSPSTRKIAVHHLVLPDGTCQGQAVVELDRQSGEVIRWYPLLQEEPFVEWVGGTYRLR